MTPLDEINKQNKKKIIKNIFANPQLKSVKSSLEHSGSWRLLNQIATSGDATKKILKILSQETVSIILRVYRVIELFKNEIDSYEKLLQKDRFPMRDFKRIREILTKHQTTRTSKGSKMIVKEKWIYQEDVDDIMNYIQDKFKQRHKGVKTLRAIGKELIKRKEKTTRPIDVPLNIVIYLLAEHLKAKTNQPNWNLICNFLEEQQILNKGDVTMTGDNLRDRYRHIKADKLKKQYEGYRDLYLFPERNINRNPMEQNFYQRRSYGRDIMLPCWFDLFS